MKHLPINVDDVQFKMACRGHTFLKHHGRRLLSHCCYVQQPPCLSPDENSLDFSSCMLRPGIKNAQELACGVCLLNVDSRSRKEEKPAEEHPKKAFNSETDSFKLAYGGHQYHASCANFWINCVEPKPPGLILPDLL